MTANVREASKRAAMKKYGFGTDEMKKIKVCPTCGAAQSLKNTVCTQCQTPLSSETLFDAYKTRHAVCRRCGEVVANGAKFCPQCGKNIPTKPVKPEKRKGKKSIVFNRNEGDLK